MKKIIFVQLFFVLCITTAFAQLKVQSDGRVALRGGGSTKGSVQANILPGANNGLCIYDLQGKQIKQILIARRGEGSQMISGSELTAGMYLYTLIADGNEVDTKRMILTNK